MNPRDNWRSLLDNLTVDERRDCLGEGAAFRFSERLRELGLPTATWRRPAATRMK